MSKAVMKRYAEVLTVDDLNNLQRIITETEKIRKAKKVAYNNAWRKRPEVKARQAPVRAKYYTGYYEKNKEQLKNYMSWRNYNKHMYDISYHFKTLCRMKV